MLTRRGESRRSLVRGGRELRDETDRRGSFHSSPGNSSCILLEREQVGLAEFLTGQKEILESLWEGQETMGGKKSSDDRLHARSRYARR